MNTTTILYHAAAHSEIARSVVARLPKPFDTDARRAVGAGLGGRWPIVAAAPVHGGQKKPNA